MIFTSPGRLATVFRLEVLIVLALELDKGFVAVDFRRPLEDKSLKNITRL